MKDCVLVQNVFALSGFDFCLFVCLFVFRGETLDAGCMSRVHAPILILRTKRSAETLKCVTPCVVVRLN